MRGGTIAAGSRLAAEAGAEILRLGGSATDAAVAAAFVSFQSEPLLASAAGGGVMLAGDPERGFESIEFVPIMPGLGLEQRPELDFREVTIDFDVTTQRFHVGRGAAAVPMGLAGLHAAHERWGRLPLSTVVAPAVRICRAGIPAGRSGAQFIRILEPIWRLSAECAALYEVNGHPAGPDDIISNPDFADALEHLAADGPTIFHRGDIADRTIEAFGPSAGGLITREDLAKDDAAVREPLRAEAWGRTLLTPPPHSSGGTLIALGLAALSRAPLRPEDYGRSAHLRAIVDAQLLMVAARRHELAGDFARDQAESVLSERGLEAQLARFGRVMPDGTPTPQGRGCTTHISVIDADGGACAVTVSNGEGCGWVIPGTGMHMNNFLGEEDINPRGFHVLVPGTTLTTMMSPTIFLRDGVPELVLGSGGSNRLRTAILQVAVNRIGFGRSLEESVRAARIHVEPDAFCAELVDADADLLRALAEPYAHRSFSPARILYFGGVHAVGRDPGGRTEGVGDPRRGGASITVLPEEVG